MSSLSVCVSVCLFVFVCVGVAHVEGGLGIGFNLPISRWPQIETPFPAGGVCAYSKLTAPKSTLYYGKNQIVVRFREFTPNNYVQLKLYGYVQSNSSTTSTAGSYNGINWSYESDSSARVVATLYNTTAPVGVPQGERIWDTVWEIDIPQGITCTPHCTAQLVGTTVFPSGAEVSAVSCADVVVMERRPTPVYLTLRPDGCCPLEPLTIARRFYEMFGSNTSINPFAATSYPQWDYTSDMSWIVSNVWYIDSTAPNTLKINPQTGYYSVKLVIHDQYNQTAQQFITTLTNTQLVSSALSPDSRGANNSYVWWGDAPNTYPGGAGKSMNAAASALTSASSISISTIATAMSALIVASYKHI